ncbi:MAG: MBL fold metallo-hydrolase [Myxococcota bacterium]
MSAGSLLDGLGEIDPTRPVRLFDRDGHTVWWVGSQEDSPFRCNVYLLVDGDVRVLFDPGSTTHHFAQVRDRVAQVVDPASVTHLVLHHQDPDLCDSIPSWIALVGRPTLVCTPRTRLLLPYYGFADEDVDWLDVSPLDATVLPLPSGRELAFLTSPFLHFPEAMVTWDEASRFLLSSDIGAAIEADWRLVARDVEAHWQAMVPFHVFYMANNRALRGFVDKVEPFPIDAMLPQHGSILPEPLVRPILARLRELPCGIDLLYPPSQAERLLAR